MDNTKNENDKDKKNVIKRNDDNNIKFFLDKDIILNNSISTNAKLVYIALRYYRQSNECITFEYLIYILTGMVKENKRLRLKLSQGLEELEQKDFIHILFKDNRCYEINLDDIYFTTQSSSDGFKNFVMITLKELRKIINLDNSATEKILIYFCYLISTLSNVDKARVGDKSISCLATMFNSSKSTIIKYNKVLEDNGLIYISKSNKVAVDNKGTILNGYANFYSRPCDRSVADASQRQKEQQASISERNKTVTKNYNIKRSLSQKLVWLKKGSEYSVEEIAEIIEYIKSAIDNYESLVAKTELDSEKEKYDILCKQRIEDLEYVQQIYDRLVIEENDKRDMELIESLEDEETDKDYADIQDEQEIDIEEQIIEYLSEFFKIEMNDKLLKKLRSHKNEYEKIKNMIVYNRSGIKESFNNNVELDDVLSYVKLKSLKTA